MHQLNKMEKRIMQWCVLIVHKRMYVLYYFEWLSVERNEKKIEKRVINDLITELNFHELTAKWKVQ